MSVIAKTKLSSEEQRVQTSPSYHRKQTILRKKAISSMIKSYNDSLFMTDSVNLARRERKVAEKRHFQPVGSDVQAEIAFLLL